MSIRKLCICGIFSCLLTAGTPVAGWAQEVELPAQPGDFHLFLLVGQSNMAGRGKLDSGAKAGDPGVLSLDKSNRWRVAKDPLHFDKPSMVGVGLGRTFASEVKKRFPGSTIGLIPCAVGGSPISSWEPGGYHKQTKSHPYDEMLPRLKLAMKHGTLKAILWHQGESDSNAQRSAVYEQKLHALIARIRAEVGSDVPFIAGQMGRFSERPWNADRIRVDAAHQALPSKISRSAFVSSDGLNHKGDQVHFDTASYRELGQRYAAAYLKLVGASATE